MDRKITLPLDNAAIGELRAGDTVLLSGTIYTGRDAAHKRFYDCLSAGKKLPVELAGETIYYVGPAPTPPGFAVGAAGPTSSYRMDRFTPILLKNGLKGMIGKGIRGGEVIESIKKYHAIYFACVGGAAVLISKSIKSCVPVCYEDLGPEAVYRLEVEDFPVIVAIDALGNDQYKLGRERYCRTKRNGDGNDK